MKPRLLVACHDAGGAEIVSSWVLRHQSEWAVTYVLRGPAVAIFERKLGREIQRDFVVVLRRENLDLVLTGTSSEASLERDHRAAARAARVRCATYLDHWKGYRERFYDDIRGLVLPDEVWVADEHASRLASAALPGVPVLERGNPYLDDVAREIASYEEPYAGRVSGRCLFVCDRGNPTVPENLEHPAAPYFRIRPHPADAPSERTLAEDVAWSDTVVGYDSMALVVALKAGRRVVSLLPASEATIPFPGIERPD